ncbi:MAG: cell division protein SepF [Candidatus Nanohaloarchaea archaeon]|nr:cell division protein SepF [Candidatus Nanohaloarchaea archaeon]
MPFRKLLGGDDDDSVQELDEDEYVELEEADEDTASKVKIRVVTLNEYGDVEQVQSMIRDGNIVWVKMKPLKDKDMTDLKRAIDRIKKTVKSVDGDVAGIDEEWLIATPAYAHIHR